MVISNLDGNIRSTVICHRMSSMAVLAVNTKTGEAATTFLAAPCRRDCAMFVKEIEDCSDKIAGLLALKQLKALEVK